MLTATEGVLTELNKTSDTAILARLIREELPASEQERVFQHMSRQLAREGLDEVEQFIANIGASPKETLPIAEEALARRMRVLSRSSHNPDSVELTKAWEFANRHLPGQENEVMGEALASFAGYQNRSLPKAVAIMEEQLLHHPHDELVTQFLDDLKSDFTPFTKDEQKTLRPLVEQIQNPNLRKTWTQTLTSQER
jgi:hypothetical protein